MIHRFRFPLVWLTCGLYVLLAISTLKPLEALLIFLVGLPIALTMEWLIRKILNATRVGVTPRRIVMMLPAIALGAWLFRDFNGFGGSDRAAVRHTLAGKLPSKIQHLHVHHDAWTDEVIVAYFESDQTSLKEILNSSPFKPMEFSNGNFHFSAVPFEDLRSHPVINRCIMFERTDIPKTIGSCTVTTDESYSFAYVQFAVE